jgi:hypothetical protein
MTKRESVRHEFIEVIPDQLEEGVLYISMPYATVLHRCLCGCGAEIVTPLSPTDWELAFNGETVSLNPSIGNWSYVCQSHYWIRRNRVHWARRMTAREIAKVREKDRREKRAFGTEQSMKAESVESELDSWMRRLQKRIGR